MPVMTTFERRCCFPGPRAARQTYIGHMYQHGLGAPRNDTVAAN